MLVFKEHKFIIRFCDEELNALARVEQPFYYRNEKDLKEVKEHWRKIADAMSEGKDNTIVYIKKAV